MKTWCSSHLFCKVSWTSLLYFLFKERYILLIWKSDRERRKGGRGREIYLPSTHSLPRWPPWPVWARAKPGLPRWPPWPGLGQSKTRSSALCPGLPCALPMSGRETERPELRSSDIGCWPLKSWLGLLHATAPTPFFALLWKPALLCMSVEVCPWCPWCSTPSQNVSSTSHVPTNTQGRPVQVRLCWAEF